MSYTRLVAILVPTLVAVSCSGGSSSAKVVTIGAVIDRTGSQAWQGWGDAIALAESDVNAALKAASYKNLQFKIVIADSANDPATSTSRALDLVQNQGARALIADSSQNDIAINRLNYDADTTNDLNVPIQCGACTSGSINNPTAMGADQAETDTLRNGELWNFKGTMPTKLMAGVAVGLLRDRGTSGDVNADGQFKVGIYASNESFGRATATDVSAKVRLMADGGSIPNARVEILFHPNDADPNTYDWTADLTRLTDNVTTAADGGMTTDVVPDALVVASFPQLHAATVSAALAGGFSTALLHFHNMRNQSAIQSLGAAKANGQEGVSHVLLDNGSSGDVFAAALMAKTGTPAAFRDSVFYDAAMTLMLATVIATRSLEDPLMVTPQQIRDAVTATSAAGGTVVRTGPQEFQKGVDLIKAGTAINYEGASGPMDYDANQSVRTRLAHFKINGTQSADLATFDCTTSDACPKQ